MTKKSKRSSKLWAIVLTSSAVFAVLVILATCSLFDTGVDLTEPDWKTLVKDTTWILSQNNASPENLVACLKNATSVCVSEDYCLTVTYGQYNYGAVPISFNDTYNVGRATIKQGGVENNLALNFSKQDENYFLTVEVGSAGNLYFFK